MSPAAPRPSSFAEVKSRLVSIRDVLEHEEQALSRLNGGRLLDVLVTIEDLKLELSHAIDALDSEALTSLEARHGGALTPESLF